MAQLRKRSASSPGGWAGCLPGIKVLLLEPTQLDAVIAGASSRSSIATVTVCLLRRNVPCGDLIHLVHPAVVLPADVAAYDVAIEGVCNPFERLPRDHWS